MRKYVSLCCPQSSDTAWYSWENSSQLYQDPGTKTHVVQQELLLEDDVRFEPRFCSRLVTIMETVQRVGLECDLMSGTLNKKLPVDEFLPIMFNKHPKDQYMQYDEQRDPRAFSVEHLLLFPTHHTGQPWTTRPVETDWDRDGETEKERSLPVAPLSVSGNREEL
uniref:Uncharacterized protein n=1 Tax=Cyclopterus lumpus TaxID=8103 RepID=A0A8C2Z3A5_CYCLU